jgi:acyl-CoA synthetase (AMP-forming)/AMP-acid ligase II
MRFALSSSVFNGGRDTGSCTANHPSSNLEASGALLSTILPRRRKVASLSSLIPLLAQVRQYVQQHAGRIAIIDANGRFGYDDMLAASARVAAALLAGREDLLEERVAFLISPGFAWVAVQLGIWQAGGVAVPLPLGSMPLELEYFVEDSQASILVFDAASAAVLRPIAVAGGIRTLPSETLIARPPAELAKAAHFAAQLV